MALMQEQGPEIARETADIARDANQNLAVQIALAAGGLSALMIGVGTRSVAVGFGVIFLIVSVGAIICMQRDVMLEILVGPKRRS